MWWATWVRGTKVMTPCLMQSSSGNVLTLPRKWLVMAFQHLQLLWMSSPLVLRCTSHVPPNLVILNAILCPSSLQMFHSPRTTINEWGKELKISLWCFACKLAGPVTTNRFKAAAWSAASGERGIWWCQCWETPTWEKTEAGKFVLFYNQVVWKD